MKSMQRKFQRLMKRSVDGSDVAVLLRDFSEADNLLAKFIDSTSAWRDGWVSIVNHQDRMVGEFELLYGPIAGSSSGTPAVTSDEIMSRTNRLHEEYAQLRTELQAELDTVENTMIRPVRGAKESLEPMKKTIKKREDRKLDFERAQNKYDNYANKTKRSDRDNTAMAKAETDLAGVTDIYNKADDVLRDRLPKLLAAIYSLIPQLLATQIDLQNSMLANYYTILHNFSQDNGLPSPPAPMDQVIQEYEDAQYPILQQIENFACLANGKSVKQQSQSQRQEQKQGQQQQSPPSDRRPSYASTRPLSRASSYTNMTTYSGGRRSSTDTHYTIPSLAPSSPEVESKPSPMLSAKPRIPSVSASGSTSNSTLAVPGQYASPKSPPLASSSSPTPAQCGGGGGVAAAASPMMMPTPSTMTPMSSGYAPAGPRSDYFSLSASASPRRPSAASTTSLPYHTQSPQPQQQNPGLAFAAAAAASKKKPPPPPKPKQPALFVTALYDFPGQGEGDLAIREGDRIKVVKKTGSTDDWWEGEVAGVRGFFPANYVE